MMAPVREAFAAVLARTSTKAPARPLFSATTVSLLTSAEDVERVLARMLTSRVQWASALQAVDRRWHGVFVDSGPGSALARFVRRNGVDAAWIDLWR
jgi:malonyl CoA-acyl carrier protein transacylase